MTSGVVPPPITYEKASKVIEKLADLGEQIVLVGGQALNFWANYYLERSIDLRANAPFTSKDIDFYGQLNAVRQCAERLGGRAVVPTMDDANTPSSGVVFFVDEDRHERVIDFLANVAGLKSVDGIPVRLLNPSGEPIATFYVIDPVSCLRSRAHNVARLPGYKTEHALKQLRAAITCVREFGRERLARGDVEGAYAVNKAVIELAYYGVGVEVFVDHAIDVLQGLNTDPGFPEKYYSHRLRYAIEAVRRARARGQAKRARSEAFAARKAQNQLQKRDGGDQLPSGLSAIAPNSWSPEGS